MTYIDPERIKKAKEMDLLTFKQLYDPYDLVRTGQNSYKLKSEPALKLSNGLWQWWSHDIGGKSALKYLEKVVGMDWREAVLLIESINGSPDYSRRIEENKAAVPAEKHLEMPPKSASNQRMESYLTGRGISVNVIKYCEEKGLLYEDGKYHNAVFLGYDGDKPAYAFCRGTGDKKVMIEARGSNKAHSFRLMAAEKNTQVHVFEAAIDALSYASLMEMYGIDFSSKNLLSLGGIAGGRTENGGEIKPPPALLDYLTRNPDTEAIVLHLDNDGPGREATEKIKKLFEGSITVKDSPPPEGKDCNDYLKLAREILKENAAVKQPPGEKNEPPQDKKDPATDRGHGAPDEKSFADPGRNPPAEGKKSSSRDAEKLRDVM